MRRRELDYRTTCSVSFYFMGPSPPYLLGGAQVSEKYFRMAGAELVH